MITDRPIGFYIEPKRKTKKPIHPREIDPRLLSPLLILEDRLPFREYREGYLLAREDGLVLNNTSYDVAAAYSDKPVELPDFYSIPVRQAPDDKEVIYRHLVVDFLEEGYQRQLLHLSSKKNPKVFDLIPLNQIQFKAHRSAYLVTSSRKLRSAGKKGQKALEQILRIIKLCQKES